MHPFQLLMILQCLQGKLAVRKLLIVDMAPLAPFPFFQNNITKVVNGHKLLMIYV